MTEPTAKKDYSALRDFVEAALTDPRHPVYQLGLRQSTILQHYAVNVKLLQALTPSEWFETVAPTWVEKLEAVKALCEEEAPPAADPMADLTAQVAALTAQLAALTAPKTNEPEPEKKDAPAADPAAGGE